jgi:hypothetical protein
MASAIETTFEFGQSLERKVGLEDVDGAIAAEVGASIAPPRRLRQEVERAGELDVDVQFLLESADRSEQLVRCLAFKPNINVLRV